MLGLWQSRKFRITLFDALVGVAVLVVNAFVPKDTGVFILQVWALMQPVVLALVLGIAVEDAGANIGGLSK